METPAITTEECDELLNVAGIQQIFQSATATSPVQVLDLGCGQSRHCIHFAKRFPSVHFHGVDQSVYLLEIARERAKIESVNDNTNFEEGELRQLPVADNRFDIIVLLGNGFGHGSDQGNLQIVREARRALKPRGVFIIDHVDGECMRSNFSPSGWEWLDPDLVTGADKHLSIKTPGMKLMACRERELLPEKKVLAGREIVIDLAAPAVLRDLFYCFRMYDMQEMEALFHQAGLCLQPQYLKTDERTPERDWCCRCWRDGVPAAGRWTQARSNFSFPPPLPPLVP